MNGEHSKPDALLSSKTVAEVMRRRYENMRQICLRFAHLHEGSALRCADALARAGGPTIAVNLADLLDDMMLAVEQYERRPDETEVTTAGGPIAIQIESPRCPYCDQYSFSIPRMGIFHMCPVPSGEEFLGGRLGHTAWCASLISSIPHLACNCGAAWPARPSDTSSGGSS